MNRLSSRSFPSDDDIEFVDGHVPRVDLADPLGCRFWAFVFGVTEIEIHHAVQLVGSAADAVSHYLRFMDVSRTRH